MTKNNSFKSVPFFITLLTYQLLHGEGRQIKSLTSINFIEVKPVDTDAQGDSCPGVNCLHNALKMAKSGENAKNAEVEKRNLSNLPTPMKLFSDSEVIYNNDFRPTPPGRSPGAGHPETNKKDAETKQHCLTERCRDEIRSTAPRYSSGVGHFFIMKSERIETNHQEKKITSVHAHAGVTDDYPPTAPGHSPGAGHPDDAGVKGDYSPTAPGHSPGAGHPDDSGVRDDNPPTSPGHSPGAGHASPGHSPGVGHATLKN